jgi:hypothetical protein
MWILQKIMDSSPYISAFFVRWRQLGDCVSRWSRSPVRHSSVPELPKGQQQSPPQPEKLLEQRYPSSTASSSSVFPFQTEKPFWRRILDGIDIHSLTFSTFEDKPSAADDKGLSVPPSVCPSEVCPSPSWFFSQRGGNGSSCWSSPSTALGCSKPQGFGEVENLSGRRTASTPSVGVFASNPVLHSILCLYLIFLGIKGSLQRIVLWRREKNQKNVK